MSPSIRGREPTYVYPIDAIVDWPLVSLPASNAYPVPKIFLFHTSTLRSVDTKIICQVCEASIHPACLEQSQYWSNLNDMTGFVIGFCRSEHTERLQSRRQWDPLGNVMLHTAIVKFIAWDESLFPFCCQFHSLQRCNPQFSRSTSWGTTSSPTP